MNRPPTPLEWTMPVNLAREPDFILGGFQVSPSLCQIRLAGAAETVEPRVMQAFVVLWQSKGRVVSRDELVGRCWGGRAVSDDAIQRCIAKVRKLGELDANGSFSIETIPRVGYQLVEARTANDIAAATVAAEPDPISKPRLPRRAAIAAVAAGAAMAAAIAGYIALSSPPRARDPRPTASLDSEAVLPAPQAATDLPDGAMFRDCASGCPEMVVVPGGYFGMGRVHPIPALAHLPGLHNDETPVHEVLIAHRLAIGRYDVTREEYARFVASTKRPDPPSCQTLATSGMFVETAGTNWRNPGFAQTTRDPVVCVSRYDAEAYAAWLAGITSKHYRLLSEAEWEYAARAGDEVTEQVSADGAKGICGAVNGGDGDYHLHYPGDRFADTACRDGYAETSPSGSFPANAFGLFDMQGNVAQWIEDCYHPTYDGAPSDGSAWRERTCDKFVVRGGSWTDDPRYIHFAQRNGGAADIHYSANGFRVALSL
jgi:sulfatase modifying factor 1